MNLTEQENQVVDDAIAILNRKVKRLGLVNTPEMAAQLCKLRLARELREVFCAMWLDSRGRVIEHEVLSTGTINAAHVYVREVVRSALLKHNAASVVFYHNHPSGIPEPSAADRDITRRLVEALRMIEVRVLDHIVVGADEHTSFATRGWL